MTQAMAEYARAVKAVAEAKRVRAINKGKAMENAEKRAQTAMSAGWQEQEDEKQTEIRSREAIRVAAKLAWRKREEEEARALVKYAENVKKIAEAKRVRAVNKGQALEQAEREAATAKRLALSSGAAISSTVTTANDVAPIKRATMFTGAVQTIVSGVQNMFLDKSTTEEENPIKEAEALAMYGKKINPTKFANSATTEAEALALYQKSLKAQQLAAAQKNSRNKGKALEGAEQIAMKSKMSHEEAEAKARLEEEEDRQARATAVRRKEAEEVAAAVSYAKSVQRVEDAKRVRAINRLKALEQAGEYVRQPAPSTDAVVLTFAATAAPIAASVVGQAAVTSTVAAITEAEALAMYANKVKAQQQAAAQKLARSKGQALENAGRIAMKSKMSHEEAEAKARLEEEEENISLATALRRKEAEEAAAAISYAKSVKRLDDAKRVRANNRGKALEDTFAVVSYTSDAVNTVQAKEDREASSYTAGKGYNWYPHSMICSPSFHNPPAAMVAPSSYRTSAAGGISSSSSPFPPRSFTASSAGSSAVNSAGSTRTSTTTTALQVSLSSVNDVDDKEN